MKILCLVKFVPEIKRFNFHTESTFINRAQNRLIVNPEDQRALAFSLKEKEKTKDIQIDMLTMAPLNVLPSVEDLIRTGIDNAYIISDEIYAGSDSYVTSKILARWIETQNYDLILSGTQSLDGDTSHVPAQVAECLSIDHMTNIVEIKHLDRNQVEFVASVPGGFVTYQIHLPVVLALAQQSPYQMPYIQMSRMYEDVSSKIAILTNSDLLFDPGEVGMLGSPTKVIGTYIKKYDSKGSIELSIDEGVDYVYSLLKKEGLIK